MRTLPKATSQDGPRPVEASKSAWRSRLPFLFILLLAAPLSFLYVNQTSSLAAAGYDVSVLEADRKDWHMRNEQLQLQVAQLESLDRVNQIASTKLGMGPPGHQVFVNAPPTSLPPPSTPQPMATVTPTSGITSVFQQLLSAR